MRKLHLISTFLCIIEFFNLLSIYNMNNVNADVIKVSPGKIQGFNIYLNESETAKAKVKFSNGEGIVLQETTGDLLFNISLTIRRRMIALYIPPEFKIARKLSYIWTSITNDYKYISFSVLSERDPIAPNWQRIIVSNGTSGISPGSYIVRVFNVTAPSIVGLYFFKIYIDGVSIGAKNFPTLLVSADPNPAYISGTIRDGSKDLNRYGKPINLTYPEGGRVIAEGVTPEGRIVIAQTFFNSSAMGKYTLYGLTTGVYRLTASAAGYSNTTKPEPVAVVSGQSLEGVDIYLLPSPRIEGIVWSKCNGMLYSWGNVGMHPGPEDGATLVYVGSGVFPNHDYIYAFRGGGSNEFFRYDTILNKWERKNSAPGSVGSGASLVFDGTRYIYALQGGGSTGFWRYDIVNDQWETLPSIPVVVNSGGSLTFNGLIYAFAGGGSTEFWSYDPATNQWIKLQDSPFPINNGASLTFNSKKNLIYAIVGGGAQTFLKYDPFLDSWSFLPNIPFNVNSGGSLTCDGNSGLIYAIAGGNTPNFYFYDPDLNLWSSASNLPNNVNSGGSIVFDNYNGLLYAFIGGGGSSFYVYNPKVNLWSAAADFPLIDPRPITIEILDYLGNTEYLLQNFTDPLSNKFEFNYYGLTELSGHIPQDGAGYISGISPGRYIIQVWINQYIQPNVIQLFNGVKINGVFIELFDYESTQFIQLDVQRTGKAEIIVIFKDNLLSNHVVSLEYSRTLTITLYDSNNVLRAQNSTRVPTGSTSGFIVLTGLLGTLRDYGLPKDTYLVSISIDGFYQPSNEFITISGCDGITQMSITVFKTGSLKLTIYSISNQHPAILKPWKYGYLKPSPPIKVEVRDISGVEVFATNFTFQKPHTCSADVSITGLRTGKYSIFIFTYGYIQTEPYYVSIIDGIVTDASVNVVIGGEIDLTVILKREGILSSIDTYPFSFHVPVRIQVLDSYGQFAAANITYISSDRSLFTIRLAGFKSYAGNYIEQRWNNYYDVTDGAIQKDYGLSNGQYTILIFLPGYIQSKVITIEVYQESISSVIMSLDRLSHLSGHVSSFNLFNEIVPLNWATVDIIGEKNTYSTSTLDGSFDLWLEKGSYLIIVSLNNYESVSKVVSLPEGSEVYIDFILKPLS